MNEKLQEQPNILCVDDERNILVSLKRLFRKDGYNIHLAESGQEGLNILEETKIDLIISDMRMPNMDGAEFLSHAKEKHPKIPSILLTGFSDQQSTIRAINDGRISAYVSKPWEDNDIKLKVSSLLKISHLEKEKERLLVLTHQQNKQLRDWNKKLEEKVEARVRELRETECLLDNAYKELSESYDAVIHLLYHAICARENIFSRKYPELPKLAEQLAEAAELSDYMVKQIYYSALLFELGKLALPEKLLTTPVKMMSVDEYKQYMNYPQIGATVLSDISSFNDTARIIEHHCEYYNGSGEPEGQKGTDISIGSRIMAIIKDYFLLRAGKYDGIDYTTEDARYFIEQNKGKLYDKSLVERFIELSKKQQEEEEVSEEHMLSGHSLEEGMVLSRDCTNKNGLLLLKKDTLLNEMMIDKILMFEKIYNSPLRVYVKKSEE
ncbi:HD domain-containing phosphohydrolase [Aliikangiella sp. G2MR2-5]|uniref:HD domain-containing phosphohydrolase n=1 Tax=Aliikangiella sp. G2MR2-5 TaxID=2788943 RepID=UPI0018A984AC|nr:HD domain-containing phosphohydrolase [Aliikangiella sp. G2MR2-5]